MAGNASESEASGISGKTTLSNRFAISLPSQHGQLSSMAMFREEVKRKCSSNLPETEVKGHNASKLTGLQKIRAKMISSNHGGIGSGVVQKKQEQASTPETSTLASGTRQARSHSNDDVYEHVSDTSFNITKLRRLAEKMRGPSRRHSDADRTQIAGMTTEGINQSKAITSESCTKIETSGDEKFHNSVITSRKRSVGDVDINCGNVIPCKSTKTNSCENLVRSCDQQTVSTGSSDMQCQSNDSIELPSPVNVVPKRTFLTTESFLQSIHDVRRTEVLSENAEEYKVYESTDVDTREMLIDKPKMEDDANSTIEKNTNVKQFNFTELRCQDTEDTFIHQRPVGNELRSVARIDSNSLPGQREQVEEDGVNKALPQQSAEAANILRTEPVEMPNETKKQVNMSFDQMKHSAITNATSDDLASNSVSYEKKDNANICSTQIRGDVITVPFQPTISGDFCVEFSPIKFYCGADGKQDKPEGSKEFTVISTDTSIKSTGPSSGEKCRLPCSQGFKTISAESQGFNHNLIGTTQPFVVISEDDQSEPEDKIKKQCDGEENTVVDDSYSQVINASLGNDKSCSTAEFLFRRPLYVKPVNVRDSNKNAQVIQPGAQIHTASADVSAMDVDVENCDEWVVVDGDEKAKELEKFGESKQKKNCEETANTEQSGTTSGSISKEEKPATEKDAGPRVIFTSGSWICQIDPNTGTQN